MTRSMALGFFAIMLLMVCINCQEIKPIPSPQYRIKTVILDDPSVQSTTTYVYTADNRLDNFVTNETTQQGTQKTKTLLLYDSNRRLVRVEIQDDSTTNQPIAYYTYEYNTDGKISVVKAYNRYGTAPNSTYYLADLFYLEYSANQFPTMYTHKSGGGTIWGTEEYTYSEGNVVNTKHTDYQYGSGTINVSGTYSKAPNPYYGQVTGVPNARNYSVNSKMMSSASYDANGLLTKTVETSTNGLFNRVTTYIYEVY